jgi:hypothetical protein
MARMPARSELIWRRLQEGAREVGILLITFAPLDVAFTDTSNHYATGALFLFLGLLLFGISLFAEVRSEPHA